MYVPHVPVSSSVACNQAETGMQFPCLRVVATRQRANSGISREMKCVACLLSCPVSGLAAEMVTPCYVRNDVLHRSS